MLHGRYELHVSAFQPRAQRGGLEFLRAVDSDLTGRAEDGEELLVQGLDHALCRSPWKRGNSNETAELVYHQPQVAGVVADLYLFKVGAITSRGFE